MSAEKETAPLTISSHHPGWLRSIQLRASTDDAENTKSSYAIRLKPKSHQQISSESELLRLHQKQATLDYEMNLNATLKAKFHLLIQLDEAEKNVLLTQRQQTTIATEKAIYQSTASSQDFNSIKLQRSELQAGSIQLALQRSQQQVQQLKKEASVTEWRTLEANLSISIDEISQLVASVGDYEVQKIESNSLKTEIFQADLYRRTPPQRTFGIDFIQLETTIKESNTQSNELSIGINLPLGNPYQRSKTISDLHSAKQKRQRSNLKINRKTRQLKSDIEFKVAEITSISRLLESLQQRLENLSNTTQKLLLIQLAKEQGKYALELNTLEHSLYRDYIEYLSIFGKLGQHPMRNWLQQNTPVLVKMVEK